jgi:hypothetical protein
MTCPSDAAASSGCLSQLSSVAGVPATPEATMSDAELGPAPRSAIRRDRGSLLEALAMIDDEGWEGERGTALLTFVREQIARPLAIDVGLRGQAASQAEASAWQAAWIAMTKPSLRRAASPWGVIWRAAKRAVLGEVVAARCASEPRRAWHWLQAGHGREPARVVFSLEALLDSGWDRPDDANRGYAAHAVAIARDALVEAGWDCSDAARIVDAVIDLPDAASDPRSVAVGWRVMADELQLPPWQARRLCVALRGTHSWPGLIARILTDGPSAAQTLPMAAAVRSTRTRRHRSPVLASQLALELPQRAAS